MEELLTYAVEQEIALIGLNRPGKRNAINDALVEGLHAAVLRAGGEAKAAVIFGHGEHFSAGLDLAEHIERTPLQGVHHSRKWHAIFDDIERGAIPFVAALHGAVVAAGSSLPPRRICASPTPRRSLRCPRGGGEFSSAAAARCGSRG